jgi:hypothetical protein
MQCSGSKYRISTTGKNHKDHSLIPPPKQLQSYSDDQGLALVYRVEVSYPLKS